MPSSAWLIALTDSLQSLNLGFVIIVFMIKHCTYS